MCGRFTLRTPLTVLSQQFLFDLAQGEEAAAIAEAYVPRYNIAPTQLVLGVTAERGVRQARRFKWGLIPSWAKDAKIAYSTLNARADTVATKPAFRSAFKRRRCLVLADGYYEWKAVDKKTKQPYLYQLTNNQPFALAGLWETWRPDGGPALETCSLITTDANATARPVHDRMPAILHPVDYDAWLDPENQNTDELQRLLAPYEPAEDIQVSTVSSYVNNARHEGAECVAAPG